VTIAQKAAVESMLRAGVDVFCDDTFLRARVVREFAELAAGCGAGFEVRDFTGVPLEVCLERDAGRPDGERVGEEVIHGMWSRYLAGQPTPLPLPELARDQPTGPPGAYRPGAGLPEAVLVDIDGTVALMGDRSPYDMSRVSSDRPNHAVITAVRAMHAFGHHIVFCSGRTDDGRADTEAWLAKHVAVRTRRCSCARPATSARIRS